MYFVRFARRRFVAPAVLFTAFLLQFSTATFAAEAPDSVAPDALRSALQNAWQNHPTYRATEAQLAGAKARLQAAGQPLYNPELEFASDDEGPDRTTTAGLNLTLDLSGKRRVRRDAAAARVDQATAEAQLRRRDFAQQWFSGWAGLQTAAARLRTGERRVQLMDRFGDLAQKQFAADDISGLERDLALLARDEAEAEQAQLIAEFALEQAEFRAVGGNEALLTDVTLPTNVLSPPTVKNVDVENLPEWQVAQANALATERDVLVAKRNRIADPTIGVNGGRIDYGGVSDNVIGVSVRIPLFVRNSYRAEVTAAEADAAVGLADADRVRLELQANQQRAIDSYAAAQSAWARWKSSRGTDVDRRTNLLEKMWREGELSTADYLQQLKQTLDTQLAGAELEARLWRSYTDYLAATGQLESWAGMGRTP